MSETSTSLCSLLLREYFGEIVQKVGTVLMKQVSSIPLLLIKSHAALPTDKVRSSLCVLIQHNMCSFLQDAKGVLEYTVKHQDVLQILNYERCAYVAQLLYGDPADLLIEEVVNNGKMIMSEAIQKVVERLQDAKDTMGVDISSEDVCQKFNLLVENQFLIRCIHSRPSLNASMPLPSVNDNELFLLPEIQLHLLEPNSANVEDQPNKKQKTEFPDVGIYWKINFPRFKQYFRDEAIISASANRFDDKASEVVKAMLSDSEFSRAKSQFGTSFPVQYYAIAKKLPHFTSQDLDAHLSNLCDGENSFVSKTDDRNNGMYVVNIVKILRRLIEDMSASIVQDRFGSKCARIFRILLAKKVLESKKLEDLAMLQPKDTKEYVFKMFEENFIVAHMVPRGMDLSHGQAFYLLKIDMTQVSRMMLERCYLALFNLMTCSEVQFQENKRLLEKKQRIDAIVANLKSGGQADVEQILEVQNVISQPEEALINKVALITNKIDSSQIQIAEMVSVLDIWLDYSKLK